MTISLPAIPPHSPGRKAWLAGPPERHGRVRAGVTMMLALARCLRLVPGATQKPEGVYRKRMAIPKGADRQGG